MSIIIRKGTIDDVPVVHDLIVELAIFENEPNAVDNTIEQLKADGFGEKPFYHLLIAENEEKETLGMALYCYGYSTWKGKLLYLDDLVIKEKHRRKGIGTKLISKLFEIARKEKMKFVKWEVLDWNEPAIKLYKKLNARLDDSWIACKFDETQIKNFPKL